MLDVLLRTALAHDPAERYPTARAFVDALRAYARRRELAAPDGLPSLVQQTRLQASRLRRSIPIDPDVLFDVARMTSIGLPN